MILADIEIKNSDVVFEDSKLPPELTFQSVVDELRRRLDLPYYDEHNLPIPYIIESKTLQRILSNDEVIGASGIPNKDILIFSVCEDSLTSEVSIKKHLDDYPDEINVFLSVIDLNRHENVNLPTKKPVGEIIKQILETYNLPIRDHLHELIKYRLQSKALGRYFDEKQTLAGAQIPTMDRLTLSREEIAGGGFPPIRINISRVHKLRKRLSLLSHRILAELRESGSNYRVDPVDITVFAPPRVFQNRDYKFQVFIHRPDQYKFIQSYAWHIDKEASAQGFESLPIEIGRGEEITLHLTLHGAEVLDPVKQIIWEGYPVLAVFGFNILDNPGHEHSLSHLVGTLRVIYKGIPIGHIKFNLRVDNEKTSDLRMDEYHGRTTNEPAGVPKNYRQAFISYSVEDRTEVMKRVQMLSILKIKSFLDILNLKPGSLWEEEIYSQIEASDLFLLFWSSNAANSEWVTREIEYALKRKNGDDFAMPEIIPVPIEGPPPVPPPPELSHINFNDYFLYFFTNK